jgi:hypothetical protein
LFIMKPRSEGCTGVMPPIMNWLKPRSPPRSPRDSSLDLKSFVRDSNPEVIVLLILLIIESCEINIKE